MPARRMSCYKNRPICCFLKQTGLFLEKGYFWSRHLLGAALWYVEQAYSFGAAWHKQGSTQSRSGIWHGSLQTFNYLITVLYIVVHINFFTDFWSFRNFPPQIRENCDATWQQKWELCSASERVIRCEKRLKTTCKSTDKRWHNTCSNYVTLEWTTRQTQSMADKK